MRLLKTDLFDEALTAGHQRCMCQRAGLVVGIDLSQAIVREAARRCPSVSCLRADVRQLPFASDVFDAVVSLSTLDHFQTEGEVAESLRELRRTLRPEGLLLLTMDNAANPLVALRNALPFGLLNRLGLVPYYVGATYGPRRLQSLLAANGFVVLETTAAMHCLRVLAVPLCRVFDRLAGEGAQNALLRFLMGNERLNQLPTRYTTGSFVAVLAKKLR